jgi:hypothetical protein
MTVRRPLLLASLLLVPTLAGCGGGGGSSGGLPPIQAARVYSLGGFEPAGAIRPGRPTAVSFTIVQPNGTALTKFKKGPGPHTGVHLIIVRRDLAYFVHQHPPIGAGGKIAQSVTLPAPGVYRVVVDVYPATGAQPNFQLFQQIRVAGRYRPKPLPPPGRVVEAGGYRFVLSGATGLKALQAQDVTVNVTDAQGRPAHFVPWFGALAHAIFFRQGSLDYFHTHVCAPGATGCTSILGPAKVTGTSAAPGTLHVGVLTDAPGTWRLFLQTKVGGHVVTAPFTLHVT